MMNATLTIIHDRKRKAVGTNKEAVLEVRVTRHRRSIHVSTGIKVRHSEWVAGRVVGRLDAQVLNDQLAIIYNKVGSAVNDAIRTGQPIDADVIKHKVWQVAEERTDKDTLIEWCAAQIPVLNISEGAKKHYRALINRLDEYRKLRRFADCTPEAICQFDAWLIIAASFSKRTTHKPTKERSATFHFQRNHIHSPLGVVVMVIAPFHRDMFLASILLLTFYLFFIHRLADTLMQI
jgi:hypothetical protein